MSYPQATSVPTSQMNDGTDDDTAAAVDFSASTSSGHGADMPENTHGNTESGKPKSRLTCNKCGAGQDTCIPRTRQDTGKPMCMAVTVKQSVQGGSLDLYCLQPLFLTQQVYYRNQDKLRESAR